MKYQETLLQEPKRWVVKKVKKESEIEQVPYDIAKQNMAVILADAFTQAL